MSGGQVFFHRLHQAAARPVKPDRGGVLRATEHRPDLAVGQALPCSQPQRFLVVVGEASESSEDSAESLLVVDRLLGGRGDPLFPT
jgi:hypothetical protein